MAVNIASETDVPKAGFAQASIAAVSNVAEPVTLEQAKAHLRVVIPDEDSLIENLVTAARQMLEQRINRALVARTVVQSYSGFSSGMPLPVVPFVGDLVVTYMGAAGESVALDPSTYYVTAETPPRLHPARGQWFPMVQSWPGAVQVQYTAGYPDAASVPAPLKQWILLAVGTMYMQRESLVVGVSVQPVPEEFMYWLWHPYKVYA